MKYAFILMLFISWGCITDNAKSSIPVTENALEEVELPVQKVIWHWENRFNREEVAQVKSWLNTVNTSVSKTFGKYPFDVHFYIHRAKKGNEPVPWAHTSRGEKQSVHFHVNMDYSLEEFLEDWTAQHEISHLSIPFVGRENSWFSEGYATFMQYQVMMVQGVYSEVEVQQKYKARVAKCKSSYQTNLTFPVAADSLKGVWNYPDMYWGGVSFFWSLNKEYQENTHQPLTDVITKYVACCRVRESTPEEFCLVLDSITKTKIASNLLMKYETQPAYLIFEDM